MRARCYQRARIRTNRAAREIPVRPAPACPEPSRRIEGIISFCGRRHRMQRQPPQSICHSEVTTEESRRRHCCGSVNPRPNTAPIYERDSSRRLRMTCRRVATVIPSPLAGEGSGEGLVSGVGGTATRLPRCSSQCWRSGRAGRTEGRPRTSGFPHPQRRGTWTPGTRRSGRAS